MPPFLNVFGIKESYERVIFVIRDQFLPQRSPKYYIRYFLAKFLGLALFWHFEKEKN